MKSSPFPRKKSHFLLLSVTAILIFAALLPLLLKNRRAPLSYEGELREAVIEPGKLNVFFIDVGQGDSALLVAPTGEKLLVDCGPAEAGEKLAAQLTDWGIESIDTLLLTHAHSDHTGGAETLSTYIDIDRAYLCGAEEDYGSLRRKLREAGAAVDFFEEPMDIPFSETVSVQVLSPLKDVAYTELNASSAVIRVSYGDNALLLCADATEETENLLLLNYAVDELKADILKVGHHGSTGSSSELFLKAVSPAYAVISVGTDNGYGHPAPSTLKRLTDAGAVILATKDRGTIQFVLDGKGFSVL